MRLVDFKPKNFSMWLLSAIMVFISVEYYVDPAFGYAMTRISQEQMFQVSAVVLFAIFLVSNIYLALFLLWATFLYAYYGFPPPSGAVLISILSSIIIYEASYRIVNDKNIKLLFKVFMWFVAANVIYAIFQHFGWDLLFKVFGHTEYQSDYVGFMGLKAMFGMIIAMGVPFFVAVNPWFTLILFVPLALSQSSCAVGAAIVAYLWQLWFTSKKMFAAFSIVLVLGGLAYAYNDSHAGMFTDRAQMWKVVLRDAAKRPLVGYGLDSFRHLTPEKQWMYWKNVRTEKTIGIDMKDMIEANHTHVYSKEKYGDFFKQGDTLDPWDNPHNELIMLFFEMGIVPLFILGFLANDIKKRFISFNKEHIQLTGFFLVTIIMSIGQFPFHLARLGIFIPIFLGAYYKLTENEETENVRL